MNKIEMSQVPLWTAIITPLHQDGSVDFKSLEGLLKNQEKFQNGVVLLGSTGEGLALSRADKESIVKFACGLKLSIPMIAGVPGHQLEEALDWIRFAKGAGVHGFLAVTPYYAKPGPLGQVKWFEKILSEAGLPVMLYNVPSRTGISLNPLVISELKNHPNLWAIKESSGKVESLKEFQKLAPRLALFCGDDGLIPEFSLAGAIGLVSVASNVWPEATRKVVELSLKQKIASFTSQWKIATDALFLASNPIPVKWLHHELKEIETTAIRAPLEMADLKNTGAVLEAHQVVTKWLKSEKLK